MGGIPAEIYWDASPLKKSVSLNSQLAELMIVIITGVSLQNRSGRSKDSPRTPRKFNQGATAVDYSIMLALVAGVIFDAVGSLGSVV